MLTEDPVVATGPFHEKRDKIKKSELYDALNKMPKPGLLHLHATAAVRVEWIVQKLCYYEFVYLN